MTVRVKLVVDSTADLPAEWLARWDIAVVPIFINFGQESIPDDGVSLNRDEFYRRLITSTDMPHTAAPPPGLAQEIIQRQLDKAEQVVVFTIASLLSSVYNTMRLAGQTVDPVRVRVYDSGYASMGIGWQVVAAAEAAAQGAGIDEVMTVIHDTRARSRLWAVLETLEYARRGGRVSNVVASFGTLLQIKPLVELRDGRAETVQRVRTMSKAVQGMIDLINAQAPLERLAVLHTYAPETGQALLERLKPIAPPDTLLVDIAPTFGVHIGPGSLGVALVQKKR